MEKLHRELLRKNRCQLAKDLDLEEICQILLERNILTHIMLENIDAQKTPYQQKVSFLNKLPTRGPDAFEVFVQSLRDTGQTHLADLLAPENSINSMSNVTSPISASHFSFLSSTPVKSSTKNDNSPWPNQNLDSISTVNSMPPNFLQTSSGLKHSDRVHNFIETKNDEGPDSSTKTPIEHMDISTAEKSVFSEVQNNISQQSYFEPLLSKNSVQSLCSTANIVTNLSPIRNNSTLGNHTCIINSSTPRKIGRECSVSDSPTLSHVTVLPSSQEFFHEKCEDSYEMFNQSRGLALIVSVVNFDPSACLDDRIGGDIDAARMELLLRQLSYEVYRLNNGTASEIWHTFKNFAAWDKHRQHESCFVVLMSHGLDGVVYGRDGKSVRLHDIYQLFSNVHCPQLQNKPKVFLIQACRGEDPDKGVDEGDAPTTEKVPTKRRKLDSFRSQDCIIKTKLPSNSDVFIAYATVPGYAAMRNTHTGSWFIQAFIQVMAFHAREKHLLEIMTMTNNQVKGREGWNEGSEFHRCKEMSEFVSSLCKTLYFFPGLYVTK